jgi:hypothetical protein
MAEKPCKPESMREEVKEHVQLWKKPAFRQAVKRQEGRKATGRR